VYADEETGTKQRTRVRARGGGLVVRPRPGGKTSQMAGTWRKVKTDKSAGTSPGKFLGEAAAVAKKPILPQTLLHRPVWRETVTHEISSSSASIRHARRYGRRIARCVTRVAPPTALVGIATVCTQWCTCFKTLIDMFHGTGVDGGPRDVVLALLRQWYVVSNPPR